MWRLREIIADCPLVVLRLAQVRLGKWIVVVMQSCRQSAHFYRRIRERSGARIVSREPARSPGARKRPEKPERSGTPRSPLLRTSPDRRREDRAENRR